ncbi:GTPase IMAP family member 7-like isoform X3 [Tachysurus vachellii]|nr:GTPase IMAP family member 7-like isoform X3 [Tachysurus vachellii]XP_060713297.1 GTPase IMAP family member 7-like isoform X3 [Tachysurus vachellii]
MSLVSYFTSHKNTTQNDIMSKIYKTRADEGARPDGPPVQKKRRNSLLEPPSMSIIIFGSSGHHQFSLTESILQRKVFNDAKDTKLTTKTSGNISDRNVTLINTPNLIDHDLFHYMSKKELKKAVCFSCPGPHAVLFTLNPFEIPPNVNEIFKQLVQYFGDKILNNTMVVLYHEEQQLSKQIEDSVKRNKHFNKLFKNYDERCFFFSRMKNRSDGEVTMELFEKIDKMVESHGIFSNPEFEDAEKRIKKEEKILQDQRKKEVNAMLEDLKKTYSQVDLERETEQYKEKIRLENREKAEMMIAERLGFALRLVDYAAAVGKGAFAGTILAGAMGYPGMAVGAAVGAVLGGMLGGFFRAVWNIISGALSDFGRHAT